MCNLIMRGYDDLKPYLKNLDLLSADELKELDRRISLNASRVRCQQHKSYKYSRTNAVKYAFRWWNGNNPSYPLFSRGDCTNFVSQCLFEGGIPMNDRWHCYVRAIPVIGRVLKGADYVVKFFGKKDAIPQKSIWDTTSAWCVASECYNYLKKSGYVEEEIVLDSSSNIAEAVKNHNIKPGDVMWLHWEDDKSYPHHATIISTTDNDQICYAAHTSEQKTKFLSEFFEDNPNGRSYILRMK